MTVTNNARRAVAARLRKYRASVTPHSLTDYIFDDPWRHNCCEDVADRLADLIEPEPERTCRVVTDKNTGSQTQEVHTKYCSECSYAFGREQHRQLLPGLDEEFVLHAVQIPDYCPNCGAKVVEVGQ